MSWRTVVISNRCKLDFSRGYMVVRGEETKRVFLDEVATLIVENTAVSLTGCLLSQLVEKKIKVVFCDEKRTPVSELVPYYGSHDCSAKIKMQFGWDNGIKGQVWTEIVREKIKNQAKFLEQIEKQSQAQLLSGYLCEIEFSDRTNREGHAAKVYFNALFGLDFTRGADNAVNAALNYGYGLVLSCFNREICANGYLTQLGIFHDNMFNHFNLSCDLMEPFRIFIDRIVYDMMPATFDTEQKRQLVMSMANEIQIDGTKQTVGNAIRIYTKSVLNALNDSDVSQLKFAEI